MIRILVADDHELVRRGLISVLGNAHPEWEIVGEAADGRRAIELGQTLRPDVAIVDLCMPGADGLKVTEELCHSVEGIKVLVLTVHSAEPVMRQVRRAGASAFLAKDEAPFLLVEAVERVMAGETFVAPESGAKLAEKDAGGEPVPVQYLLTPRELDVLRLLVRGLSNKEAAGDLNMSVRTVESHRADIFDRLSVASLGELVRIAIRDGVV